MEYTINVLRTHIDRGHRDSCYYCPIALAASQQLGQQVFVGKENAGRAQDAVGSMKVLPKEARAFIRAFDAGKSVKPFSFTLDL